MNGLQTIKMPKKFIDGLPKPQKEISNIGGPSMIYKTIYFTAAVQKSESSVEADYREVFTEAGASPEFTEKIISRLL